jgi:hypothetical protein
MCESGLLTPSGGLEYTCTRNFQTTIAIEVFKPEANCIDRLCGPQKMKSLLC